MTPNFRHRINAGLAAVKEQCAFFRDQFANVPSEWKADDTRVTFADFAISERIFAELRRFFPEDDYCSEESNAMDDVLTLTGRYAWVLDPIDGTNNYALGVPICAISLALLKDGIPVYGYIYDYSRDQLVHGGPGQGLYDGKRKVRIEDKPLDARGVIGCSFPMKPEVLEPLLPLLSEYRVRSLGSAAMNMVYTAIGLLEGCIDYRVKVWDVAGGNALIIGAGGEYHSLSDTPTFPLEEFHVDMGRTPFYAGKPAFCRLVEALNLTKP